MIAMRFEGGSELAGALGQLSARVAQGLMREALTDGAEPIRAAAQALAPRAPGQPDIADHITISTARPKGGYAGGVSVGPERGQFYYGYFLEHGTVHMGARPFMRPAFDASLTASLEIIRRSLWVELAGKGIGRSAVATGPISGGPGGAAL